MLERTYRDEHLKCINALETVLQSSDKLRCFSGKALMQVSNHCSVTVHKTGQNFTHYVHVDYSSLRPFTK